MIINSLDKTAKSDRDVDGGSGYGRRLLIEGSPLGDKSTDMVAIARSALLQARKNHLKAFQCVDGDGGFFDRQTGEVRKIALGTMSARGTYDKQWLKVSKTMTPVCVFDPPPKGNEQQASGSDFPVS